MERIQLGLANWLHAELSQPREMFKLVKQVVIVELALVLLRLHLDQASEGRWPRLADEQTAHFRREYVRRLVDAGSNWLDLDVNASLPLHADQRGDQPVAGFVGGWWKRTGSAQAESRSEIPNYPLDDPRNLADANKVTHLDEDLRQCLGQVRDQLKCGSCYAFAWNALAEWHYCRQTGKLIDFSEQHMIDCGDERRLQGGCVTGSLLEARKFIEQHGFHLESDYPYKGKKQVCAGLQGAWRVQVRHFTRIPVDRLEWEQVLKEQPILVSTRLPADIGKYQRGIQAADDCQEALKHGMLLVGYGRDQGRPYWLLRNSSGPDWGEGGYLRLERDTSHMDKCFASAFVARFRFERVDEEDYYKFQPQYEPADQAEPEGGARAARLSKAARLESRLG